VPEKAAHSARERMRNDSARRRWGPALACRQDARGKKVLAPNQQVSGSPHFVRSSPSGLYWLAPATCALLASKMGVAMKAILFGAAVAAAVISAPASAAAFVQYGFSGWGSGWVQGDPGWHETNMVFGGTIVFDIEKPYGPISSSSLLDRGVSGDTLWFSTTVYTDRGELPYSVSFVFEEGTLNGSFPTELDSASLIGGHIGFQNGGYWPDGIFGTGVPDFFTAQLAPEATQEEFGISVSAVPEPATWAMMIIGFGAIGGAMRSTRRKQQVAVSYA